MVWFLERCWYSLVSLPREMLNMVWFWVPREMLVQFDFFLERRILPPTPLEVVQHLSRHTIRLSRRQAPRETSKTLFWLYKVK